MSGVLVPGRKGIGEHVRAGKVIMKRPDLRGQPIPVQAWHSLRDEMLDFDGHSAVYSYEALVGATKQQAQRMVGDLSPADVRIVLTVRDLVRVVPAAWQEVMQGGQQWTWDQFVATVTSRAGRVVPPGRAFWRNNDMVAVAERWAEAVGPDHVTVVTVPPRGAGGRALEPLLRGRPSRPVGGAARSRRHERVPRPGVRRAASPVQRTGG